MKTGTGRRSAVRSIVVAGALVTGLVAAPAPARADCPYWSCKSQAFTTYEECLPVQDNFTRYYIIVRECHYDAGMYFFWYRNR